MSLPTTLTHARQEFVMRQLRDWLRREEVSQEAEALRRKQRELARRFARLRKYLRRAS